MVTVRVVACCYKTETVLQNRAKRTLALLRSLPSHGRLLGKATLLTAAYHGVS